MESLLVASLPPAIQSQELKIDAMRQVIAERHQAGKNARAGVADEARSKTAQIRILTYPFSSDTQLDASAKGSVSNKISLLKNNETGELVYRFPTQTALEIGEKAKQNNIQRVIDILV